MKHRTGLHYGKVATLAAVTVMAFTMLTGVAFAGDISTATLTGGNLSISQALAAGTFSGQLDGTAKILDGAAFSGFSIDDPRGTGVGWNVTMKATQFDNGNVADKDLAVDSFTAPLFGVAKADAGSSAVPGTLHAAATIDNATGVVMAACSANGQGMGAYDFTAAATAWKLALTADEYAGTYSSTVTTTLSTLALP